MVVTVGSQNPVKINAVKIAFETVWHQKSWQVNGIDAPSQVSPQPMSDTESITGARNRAQFVLDHTKADYGVGIEGGIQKINDKWFDCGWVVIKNRENIEAVGSSARIETPPQMMELIHQGKELGDVIDIFFHTQNAKQADGHFGLMTNGHVTRTSGYIQAVIMALSRYLHPDLY